MPIPMFAILAFILANFFHRACEDCFLYQMMDLCSFAIMFWRRKISCKMVEDVSVVEDRMQCPLPLFITSMSHLRSPVQFLRKAFGFSRTSDVLAVHKKGIWQETTSRQCHWECGNRILACMTQNLIKNATRALSSDEFWTQKAVCAIIVLCRWLNLLR